MNNFVKGMLVVLAIIYVVSPIDLISGSPVDDIIVVLLTIAAQKRSKLTN